MEPNSSTSDQAFLDELRRHRADLRESMSTLENALGSAIRSLQPRCRQRHSRVAAPRLPLPCRASWSALRTPFSAVSSFPPTLVATPTAARVVSC